jgi:hypothetical protein
VLWNTPALTTGAVATLTVKVAVGSIDLTQVQYLAGRTVQITSQVDYGPGASNASTSRFTQESTYLTFIGDLC